MLVACAAGTVVAKRAGGLAAGGPAEATVQPLPGPLPLPSWPDLSIDTVRSAVRARRW